MPSFKTKLFITLTSAIIFVGSLGFIAACNTGEDAYVTYIADPKKQHLKMFWKDENGKPFQRIGDLKSWLTKQGSTLVFAMNAGIYQEDRAPLGLFVEDGVTKRRLNKATGYGNFYMQPNGVFYITTDGRAGICATKNYAGIASVRYATQSGPLLLVDGAINSRFSKGSSNLYIRNGVGILPGNKVLFAMSKKTVSLYDFAAFFKSQGCSQALFFDGFVSRTYLPEKNWVQTDGDFGPMVAVVR